MLEPWISNLAIWKLAITLILAAPIVVALRLGWHHRREQSEWDVQDNRTRSLFQPNGPDRSGDRTAELLGELLHADRSGLNRDNRA